MNRWQTSLLIASGILTGAAAAGDPAEAAVSVPARKAAPETARFQAADESDLRAGDNAFAQKDYPVAVSFYTKYLRNAEKNRDTAAVKTAYERLLDALVMSKIPALAEEYLNQYEKLYPGTNVTETAMWRGDILYQKKKYQEAFDLCRKLLETMTARDPRRIRTLFAYGQVLEKLGRWKEAAAQYERLRLQAADTPLGRRAFVRLILCLAADRRPNAAWELLLNHLPATAEDREVYSLLAAYITLRQSGVEAASGAWQNLSRTLRDGRNPLTYLTASAYGDAFAGAKDYSNALGSYRTAFHAASDKNEMFDTLNRMVEVLSQTEDKVYAARLAMSQLELFKDSLLNPAVKLRTARLLRDAGNLKGALELYESVFANINSSDAEKKQAIYEYALLLGRSGRFEEAEKTVHSHFQSGREADGEFLLAEILVQLAQSDLYMKKYQFIADRWPERAAKAYQLAVAACLDGRLPERALEFLGKLRRLPPGPGHGEAWRLYAEAAARAQKNQKEEALKLYTEFLKLADRKDPLIPIALYHSGLLAFSRQELQLSADRLSRFRKEYPDHSLAPQASAWLIQIYAALNDVIAAERETWLLAERHPDSEYAVDALFRLAAHYVQEGAREKATSALRKLAADSRFPKIQSRAIYELAYQAYRNGERKTAGEYLRQLYEKFPDTPMLADGYYLQGDMFRSDSDFKSAIPFYRKVVELRPGSLLAASASGSIGDCLLAIASQDPASSRNELLSAIQIYKQLREQPNCPPAFEAMAMYRTGRCLELLGQRIPASEQYRQILYKFPASAAASHPVETVWCVRAAEALTDIAGKYPVQSALRHARYALHWLADAGMIPLQVAAERFDKLKKEKFNP